jgi:3-dehydroquinate dehydratase
MNYNDVFVFSSDLEKRIFDQIHHSRGPEAQKETQKHHSRLIGHMSDSCIVGYGTHEGLLAMHFIILIIRIQANGLVPSNVIKAMEKHQ